MSVTALPGPAEEKKKKKQKKWKKNRKTIKRNQIKQK